MKNTVRRFVLSVPTGETEPAQVRTFVRAADGTDYPVDRTIEVPKYASETVEFDSTQTDLASCTEAWVLQGRPAGTLVLETQDIVTVVE